MAVWLGWAVGMVRVCKHPSMRNNTAVVASKYKMKSSWGLRILSLTACTRLCEFIMNVRGEARVAKACIREYSTFLLRTPGLTILAAPSGQKKTFSRCHFKWASQLCFACSKFAQGNGCLRVPLERFCQMVSISKSAS